MLHHSPSRLPSILIRILSVVMTSPFMFIFVESHSPFNHINPPPPPLSMSELLASVLNLVMSNQTALQNHALLPAMVVPIMYIIEAALLISLNLQWQVSDSNLSLFYVRQDRKHIDKGFLILPIPLLSFALPLSLPSKMFPLCPLISYSLSF